MQVRAERGGTMRSGLSAHGSPDVADELAWKVEFQVDDGSGFVRGVLWTPAWDHSVGLGDLVLMQGKLNASGSREDGCELRISRISRITDSNEEVLHWLDVVELTASEYDLASTALEPEDSKPGSNRECAIEHASRRGKHHDEGWESIAKHVFDDLKVDEALFTSFLAAKEGSSSGERMLIKVVNILLSRQHERMVSQEQPVALRVNFPDLLECLLQEENVNPECALNHSITRQLRQAFVILRGSGLLYMEDADTDTYVFMTRHHVLAPAVLAYLGDTHPVGAAMADVADHILSQPQFRCLPLAWLEQTVAHLLADGAVTSNADGDDAIRLVCVAKDV
ncbi:hypothetical protein PINS_up010565 [Pythium insidiosum]|nr:hypothetical protein PINS_up010565 [Pythium insidiosum]